MAAAQGSGSTVPLADEPRPVSVICTARNAAPTIKATIRSIIAQDFQNWEMIIVDDGSTDDTVGVIHAFAQADPRISFVATEGIGRGQALNRALAEAEADLVANIDADDESHPYRLRYELEAMRQHPEFAIVATEYVIVNAAASPVWPSIDPGPAFAVEDVTRALAIRNPICHSSAMMRKTAVIGLGGYNEDILTEDYDLWVRCAAAGLRLGQIQTPLVAKRIHPDQKYMHAARARYLGASFLVQWRAVRIVGLGAYYLPVMVALPVIVALRLAWLVLPLGLRLRLCTLATIWKRIIIAMMR